MKKLMFLFLLMGFGTLSMFAQNKGKKVMKQADHRVERLATTMQESGFSLSDKQKTQLLDIFEANNDKMSDMRKNAGGDREKMRGQMQAMQKTTDAKIMYILSDEQKEVYKEVQAKRANRSPRGGMKGTGGVKPIPGQKGSVERPRGMPDRGGKKGDIMKRLNHMSETLDAAGVPLTDFQRDKIKGLMRSQFSELKTLREQTKSDVGVKSEAKKIRKKYRDQIKSVLTKKQAKALKKAKKSAPTRI